MRCEELSERMPLVAAGSGWTPDELAHLAGCRVCADEWLVVAASRHLGREGATLDGAEVAARVLATLPARRATRRPGWRVGALMAAAAVLALAVGVGRSIRQADVESPVIAAETVLTELDGLTGAELEEITAQLEVDEIGSITEPGLADLTHEELERLLRSWEG